MLTVLPQDLVRAAIQLEVAGVTVGTADPRDIQPWGLVNVDPRWSDLRPAAIDDGAPVDTTR